MIHNDATQAQIEASDPHTSMWLSANAGSGKTRVLTDRVARLLLAGEAPQNILCLTYTKAAANEMQNRLFERLGNWAMMPDQDLRLSLESLGIAPKQLEPDTLARARRLFAQAIETPGGLKIQTIHSFCAALLRRFPLEAGVSPGFREMDDRDAKRLHAEVLEEIATIHPGIVQDIADIFTGAEIDDLLREITTKRELFQAKNSAQELRAALELPHNLTTDTLVSQALNGQEASIVEAALPALENGSKTDQALAKSLRALHPFTPSVSLLQKLEPLFLALSSKTSPFSIKKTPPTGDTRKKAPEAFEAFDAFRARIEDARPKRLALDAFQMSLALVRFASLFLAGVEKRKQALGWLDFDDQIHKARDLLSKSEMADWIRFRLDGGIDHILVDEAQDTSPAQWDVIRFLADEFTQPGSARSGVPRTLFVVGDLKQSIYSFQGADPAAFGAMNGHFSTRHESVSRRFESRELLYSFRSARPILELVDATFGPEKRQGLGDRVEHLAFKDTLPGRVDLWPWIATDPDDRDADPPWHRPVDRVSPTAPSVQLAQKIARFIRDQLAHGQLTTVSRIDGQDIRQTRAIRPRDFLILVQTRGQLFHSIIQACKELGLPLAGADRLKMGDDLAVQDLICLLRYLATPEDDLSLAVLLRSPLGGLSEAELYTLAQGRENTFLRQRIEESSQHVQVREMLRDLRNQTDFLRPYELLERVLTRHGGRAKIVARLGRQSEDAIDVLLDQALAYEQVDVPNLTGFLAYLDSHEVEVKREVDTGIDHIRVMTVHGAKGLEAPIVILPQSGKSPSRNQANVLGVDGIATWRRSQNNNAVPQMRMLDDAARIQREEQRRLLYVAMTRAESWLIVAGAGQVPKTDGEHWYPLVEAGLNTLGAYPQSEGGLTLASEDWPGTTAANASQPPIDAPREPPAWAISRLPAPVARPELLSPSLLGGEKVVAGADTGRDLDLALAYGTALHLALERLPDHPNSDWPGVADQISKSLSPPVDPSELLGDAKRVLTAPALAHVFAPDALREVPVQAQVEALGGRGVQGTIDRLVILPGRIQAIDFKTNQVVPARPEDTPDGLLRQMGAYLAVLEEIYPDREIELAILWTRTAHLMTLPHDIVRVALSHTHIS